MPETLEMSKAKAKATAIVERLGPAAPLALVAATLPFVGFFTLLWLVPRLAPWLREHGLYGFGLYVIAYSLLAGLAVLPTNAQSVLAGFAFRAFWGSLAAVSGFMAASTVAYLVGRRVSGDRVVQLIEEHPKWKAVQDALVGGSFWKTLGIITLVRLNSPFALTNLALAATKVPWPTYALGTLIGLTPRTLVAVFIGASWQDWHYKESSATSKWVTTIEILVGVLIVAIIGHIANQAIARVTSPPASCPPKPDQP